MTDEEMKRLEELARDAKQVASYGGDRLRWLRFTDAATPAAVLALIERVRKADGQLATIAATLEYEGPVEGVAQAVKEYARASVDAYVKAERRGAEEMRREVAERVLKMPLPGDAP